MSSVSASPEAETYHRQTLIERDGHRWHQQGIHDARVLVVGAGNIGSAGAVFLTLAGFVHLDILDRDTISQPNLSRGAGLFRAADVGRLKSHVVAERLREINPTSEARGLAVDVRWQFGTARFRDYDLILLATHDMASRRHVNRYVHLFPGRTRAVIEGAISDLSFSVETIVPGVSPCYACPLPPDLTDPEAYQGCNGLVGEVELPPAATNGMDGAAVAALMAKEAALIAAGLDPFFAMHQLRFDGEAATADLLRRVRRESCAEHHRARPDELLVLPFTATTPVVALRAAVAARTGVEPGDVRLFSMQLLLAQVTCVCGRVVPVWRPQQAPYQPLCPACGNRQATAFQTDVVSELGERDGRTALGDYGIPDGQALEAFADGAHYFLLPGAAGATESESGEIDDDTVAA